VEKAPASHLGLFHGSTDFSLIHPFPEQSAEEKAIGDDYVAKLEKFPARPISILTRLTAPASSLTHVMKGFSRAQGLLPSRSPRNTTGLRPSPNTITNRAMHLVSSLLRVHRGAPVRPSKPSGVPQPFETLWHPGNKRKK